MNRRIGRVDPSDAKLLLFFRNGEDYLKRLVLPGIDYDVFDPLSDVDYKWTGVLKAVFQGFKFYRGRLLRTFSSVNAFKSFLKRCRAILIAQQIRDMNPLGVLTFIDNSTTFHMVCEHCKGIPFLAIQNGGRHLWCARDACQDPELKYHIDEYYCFGPQVKRLFDRHGHHIGRYIPCGSLLGGFFFSEFFEAMPEQTYHYDICLVSQWASHFSDIGSLPKGWKRIEEAINRVTELVARLTRERGMRVCVALRNKTPEERDYYEKYFGGLCVFQESDRHAFSSYKAVTASNLSLGLNSTLLSEAFGAGKKVLFINPFNEDQWIPTEQDGFWYLSEPTYEVFRDRVDEFLKMDIDTYKNKAGAAMADSMSFNFDRPAHVVIRERLLELTSKGGRQSMADNNKLNEFCAEFTDGGLSHAK